MRQRRWLELIKDYDCTINYHPGKANVVANALSMKSMGLAVVTLTTQHRLLMDLEKVGIEVITSDTSTFLASLIVQPTSINRIKAAQKVDLGLEILMEEVGNGSKVDFSIFEDGVLRFRGRLCVPANEELKMIPEWKWEHISMDFVTGLPRTLSGQDVIWVIVDRLTKTARFVPIKVSYKLNKLTELYVREIVKLHGVLVSIVSDRDPRFTSKFWRNLQEAMGTKLSFNTVFHPQTDG
ncbi:uncharacterized protein LOC121239486 [Juglans microcarpa x Juglans regia]|uniref:uncharacterized protein LOC121239486 n=1 Tax=Juglans microcarpa x Juglans regia TaxID=2249226 RepID=UPI001B7DB9C1|nr:uncharacterized protein LOC121239486 [Juglans microcarpa x Juglans regia]